MKPWVALEENWVCLFSRGNTPHLTPGRTLETQVVASTEGLTSLFVHAKFSRTHFVRTMNIPKIIEDETCRYFYAHENNLVKEKSKIVCTEDNMTNVKKKFQNMDIVDHWTRERGNTNWKSYNFKFFTIFTTLIQDIPMGCEDTVIIASLLKNYNENCVTCDRNTKQPNNRILFFLEHVLYICKVTMNWNRKLFFSLKTKKEMPQNFKVLEWTEFQKLKTFCSSKFLTKRWFLWWRTFWWFCS